MRKYIEKAKTLAFSSTAKDTYFLFAGNIASAFFSFVFTWFVARALSVSEFGVFSAVSNLVYIISPLVDLGISGGLVEFASYFRARGEEEKAKEFVKASFVARSLLLLLACVILVLVSPFWGERLFASSDFYLALWTVAILLGIFWSYFFSTTLQAYRRFITSAVVDNAYAAGRVMFVIFLSIGGLTLYRALGAFALAGIVAFFAAYFTFGFSFLKKKPSFLVYKKLISFSGWLGVNRVLSSISGRADIQMLAALAGATVTGYYSVASRLAFFIVVLASSFASVISPRLASMGDRSKEKVFIRKSLLAVLGISLGIVVWVLLARPFILLLFGEKYENSVAVFQWLALSMIPFVFTAPSVSAVVYALKKPKVIGVFSFVQTALIFVLNYLLIPKIGPYGPVVTYAVTNTALALWTWGVVVNYYWVDNSKVKTQKSKIQVKN